MSRDSVFMDTSCLVALLRPADSLHEAAKNISRQLELQQSPIVTSDWVLAEFLNAAADDWLRVRAGDIARQVLNDSHAIVVAASRTDFLAAFDFYESRPDKSWSLVDCSSILICRERRIKRVFTHDRHFRQAGFEILL